MKYIKTRFLAVTIIAATLISVFGITRAQGAQNNSASGDTVDIVFSTDTHSYLSSYLTQKNGKTVEIGGVPRISSYVKEKREQYPELLLLDAGDYPMGTLYQTLYTKEAFEYQLLSKLRYDAVTFGNHDFDYGTEGMAMQFEAAKEKCDYYPEFIICNVDWNAGDAATNRIIDAMSGMNLCEYKIFERNGVRIGITGVLGKDALSCAPTCELTVLDPVESVKNTVAKMKAEENPDCIIVISHSGTTQEGSKEESEDETLAKEVPDIDFIVSGHTHIVIPDYIRVGDTYIGSTGCYGENMGYVQLKKNQAGRFDLVKYEITPMDEKIAEDSEILEILDGFDRKVDEEFLAPYGYTAHQVIGHNTYDFASVDDCYFIHDDHNLGQFIADAYRWKISNSDTGNTDRVYASVAPSGTIRATFPQGDITVAKVYEVFSLGMGLDGTVGYPMVDVYLTGEELLTVCEIDASISPLMTSANLYLSGLDFEFNPNRALLNKTTDAWIRPGIDSSEREEIDSDKLYRVVTDLYSMRMLGAVKNVSKGLISLEPKLKDGSPVTDESQCVIHDKDGNEIKAWIAIADYLQSMDEDNDGIGEVPALYDGSDDRKIVNDSKSVPDNIRNTNKYFWIFLIIINIIVAIVVIIVIWLAKHTKKAVKKAINRKKEKR